MHYPNPVIVIPGVLGSKLVAEGDAASVWGEWHSGFSDPATDEGRRLFGLPMAIGTPLHRLQGASRADRTLGLVRGSAAGVPVTVTAYDDVMSALGVESYAGTFLEARETRREDGQVAFEFSYD